MFVRENSVCEGADSARVSDLYTRALILGAFLVGILAIGGVALLIGMLVRRQRDQEDNFDVGVRRSNAVQVKVSGRKKSKKSKKSQAAESANVAERGLAGEQDVYLDDPGMAFGVVGAVAEDAGLGMPLAVSELDQPAEPLPMPMFFDETEDVENVSAAEPVMPPPPAAVDVPVVEVPAVVVPPVEPPPPVTPAAAPPRSILPVGKARITVANPEPVEQLPPIPADTEAERPFGDNSTEDTW